MIPSYCTIFSIPEILRSHDDVTQVQKLHSLSQEGSQHYVVKTKKARILTRKSITKAKGKEEGDLLDC
jgi:hypothetical protein